MSQPDRPRRKRPLLARLEARFGSYAIPNLTGMLIAGQIMLFFLEMVRGSQGVPAPLAPFYMSVPQVLSGEVWRLLTFLFVPAGRGIFIIFFWWLYYLYGTTLENQWGTFRYNIFLFICYVLSIVGLFAVYFLAGEPAVATNLYLYGVIFLAFARLYPDFVINVMFVLPIKIKWLALLTWLLYAVSLLSGDWTTRSLILAAVISYLAFFGRQHWLDLKHRRRRQSFQSKTKAASQQLVHECLVCGLDSQQSPKTLFRYCSQCAGQCCYCPDHIRDHEHVVDDASPSATPAASGSQ